MYATYIITIWPLSMVKGDVLILHLTKKSNALKISSCFRILMGLFKENVRVVRMYLGYGREES